MTEKNPLNLTHVPQSASSTLPLRLPPLPHPLAASKRMRPSTPSNSTLRAMAGLGSATAAGGGAAAATPLPAVPPLGGAQQEGGGGSSRRLRPEGGPALTPAAASILNTLEIMEKKVGAGEGLAALRRAVCMHACIAFMQWRAREAGCERLHWVVLRRPWLVVRGSIKAAVGTNQSSVLIKRCHLCADAWHLRVVTAGLQVLR